MQKYPKVVSLEVGALFERLPKRLMHQLLEGTYPIYGREILEVLQVSEHKLEVELGYNVTGETRAGVFTADYAVIGVYGEIDLYIKDLK